MSTTSEELKKLYKKLGGDEENIRKASTPAEILNGINELDFGSAIMSDAKIEDLKDVEIVSPVTGDTIKYDGEKWVNVKEPDMPVVKSVSGNPVEFDDGASAPLVKCVSAIQGSQDLHGYDKPWVGGAGKNLALIADSTKFNSQACTLDYKNNGVEITATGNYSRSGYSFAVTTGTTYTISFWAYGNTYNQIYFHDANAWTTGYGRLEITSTRTKYTKTITADSNILFVGFYCTATGTSGSMVIEDFMIEAGEQATAFAPYSNICPITAYDESTISVEDENEVVQATHSTTFPSAIYRGSEDVVNGEVTEEWKVVDLGSLEWSLGATFYAPLPLVRIAPLSIVRGICTCYGWSTNVGAVGNIDDKSFVLGDTYAYIYIKDTSYTSAADFKTAMTGQQVAYELATPTTETITPTNLPIKSLFGYSHIESSTGDLDVDYINGAYDPLIQVMSKQVVANPTDTASETLTGLKVGDTTYSVPQGGGGSIQRMLMNNTITIE